MSNLKKSIFILFVTCITCHVTHSQTIDSLGLPGDNLNLYGVLYLFKESKTVEEFEKKLNSADNKVNNLDLNHDGQTDYIRVIDSGKNGLHTLILTDPITAKESQDIAVIEVEQKGNGVAHIQIVGDEDLYGKDYIIEPQDQQKTKQVESPDNRRSGTVIVNVWSWPGVQYMYAPSYSYWSSPWYWGYYPVWWSPWVTINYPFYWQGMYSYRSYHHRVYQNRMIAAHNLYYGGRRHSAIVHNNIHNNVYYGPRKESKQGNQRNDKNPNPRSNGRNNDETGQHRDSRDDRERRNPNSQPDKRQSPNENSTEKRNETEKQDRNPNPRQNTPRQERSNPDERRNGNPNQQPNSPRQERTSPSERRNGNPNPQPNSPRQERTKPNENRGGNPNPQPNSPRQNKSEPGNRGGGKRN